MKKIINIILVILIAFNIGISFNRGTEKENIIYNNDYMGANEVDDRIVSLYIWDIKDINLAKLKDEVDYLKVNTLYIEYNEEQKDRFKQIMEFAKLYKLDVFILGGSSTTRDALTNEESTFVKDLIDNIATLNQELDYKIKGVSLDIEFYLTDEYQKYTDSEGDTEKKKELFKTYTANNKKYCDYANSKGLAYAMALPVWLNKLDNETLEELMNYKYDHIAFMNYYKETIMNNLDEEVEIAKKYNLNIVSIAELQDPSNGSVGEEDTFYIDGLSKCLETLSNLQKQYYYDKLGVSYHYYLPLLKVLERDTSIGIQNKYELEIKPIKDDVNVKMNDVTVSDDSIKYLIDKDNKIILLGLEYGKEYTITIKNDELDGTKTFTYQKDDSSFNELEMNSTDVLLEERKEEVKPSKPVVDSGSTETIPDTGIDFDILGFIIPGILIVLIAICSEVDDAYTILNRIIKK